MRLDLLSFGVVWWPVDGELISVHIGTVFLKQEVQAEAYETVLTHARSEHH